MEDNIIELFNEDNELEKFHVLGTFGLDDNSYTALIPVEGDNYILILKIMEDEDGNTILIGIDDEEELEDAIEAYESLNEENLQ